jgi:RNA polymerase sigma-70 factor (ECF subfamily)
VRPPDQPDQDRSVDPDEQLLERWREGDAAAGDELVVRYVPQLTKFFMGHAREQTQDLVQGTLLALQRTQMAGTVIHSFRAYLFAIARNQLLMWLRHADVEHRSEHFLRAGLPCDPRTLTTPSAGVSRAETRTAIQEALHTLPFDFQMVVKLYYWHDLTMEEVAAATGVEVGTVKSRLSRARARLSGVLRTAAEQTSTPAPALTSGNAGG